MNYDILVEGLSGLVEAIHRPPGPVSAQVGSTKLVANIFLNSHRL